jgi:hypothetical protein
VLYPTELSVHEQTKILDHLKLVDFIKEGKSEEKEEVRSEKGHGGATNVSNSPPVASQNPVYGLRGF